MTLEQPILIIQIPSGGALDGALSANPPASVTSGRAVVERGATDEHGILEPNTAGEVVLSVPSPEVLAGQAPEVRRVIGQAGYGIEPLVVVVEAAEILREEELTGLLEAATRTARPVILRVIRNA